MEEILSEFPAEALLVLGVGVVGRGWRRWRRLHTAEGGCFVITQHTRSHLPNISSRSDPPQSSTILHDPPILHNPPISPNLPQLTLPKPRPTSPKRTTAGACSTHAIQPSKPQLHTSCHHTSSWQLPPHQLRGSCHHTSSVAAATTPAPWPPSNAPAAFFVCLGMVSPSARSQYSS
uniref:Uncharacterized protein n=1 Tax=Haptolina ericina TaxID=156174 RepID=A0A7S3BP60_9EUKA